MSGSISLSAMQMRQIDRYFRASLDETARKGSLQPTCVDVGTYIPDRLQNQATAFKGPFMCDFATIGRETYQQIAVPPELRAQRIWIAIV